MSMRVVYKNVDFEKKKKISSIEANNFQTSYSNIDLLKFVSVPTTKKATLEKNFWRLDGSFSSGIALTISDEVAFWSSYVSSDIENEGFYYFQNVPEIIFNFSEITTVKDFCFTFDFPDYCNKMIIYGYSENKTEPLFQEEFSDFQDNVSLTKEQNVNSVKFSFLSMNKPNRFLRLFGIDFGKSFDFNDDEIFEHSILNEVSLISDSIPIGTCNLSLSTQKKNEIEFLKYKPIIVYKNNVVEQVSFISSFSNNGRNLYSLETGNSILLLNDFIYSVGNADEIKEYKTTDKATISSIYGQYGNDMGDYGGAFLYDATLEEYIKIIMERLLIRYKISDELKNIKFTGAEISENRRDVLSKLLLSSCSVCIVEKNGIINIKKLPNSITEIEQSRIFSNMSIQTTEKINRIDFEINSYSKKEKEKSLSGTATLMGSFDEDGAIFFRDAFVRTSVPTEGRYNIIRTQEANRIGYEFESGEATNVGISATVRYFVILNTPFTKSINLDVVDSNNIVNSSSLSGVEYLEESNYENVVNMISDFYKHNSTLEFNMELKNENCGDIIVIPTIFGTKRKGRIEKIEYSMKGKKIGSVRLRLLD